MSLPSSGWNLLTTFTFSSGNKVVAGFDLVQNGYVQATKSSVGTYSYSKSGNKAVLKITTQWYDLSVIRDPSNPDWETSSGTGTINLDFSSELRAAVSIWRPGKTYGEAGYAFSYVQG